MPRTTLFVAALLFTIGLQPHDAYATWPQNGARVGSSVASQYTPEIAGDGQGGALIVWTENRSGLFQDVYAQRLDPWGRPMWAPGAVALCVVVWDQANPIVMSDGAGGGIFAWEDYRNMSDSDVYAQRVDAAGNIMWTANGLAVSAQPWNQNAIRMTRDSGNGAIITWQDVRANPDWNIYAQSINGAGVAQWPVDGLAICSEPGNQFRPDVVGDGLGGVIIAWEHEVSFQYDIHAQHVSRFGGTYWAAAGVELCGNNFNQGDVRMVSDDVGGAIVVWRDDRTGAFNTSSFAQRVTSAGYLGWTLNGVDLCSVGFPESNQQIISDGSNGAIVAWVDGRNIGEIVLQRINLGGALMWPASGVLVCSNASQKYLPRMTTDGVGGAIVSWLDMRYESWGDVFARRVDATGTGIGSASGVPIMVIPGYQPVAPIASDGAGGAIMVSTDGRDFNYTSAFAQRLDRYNNWGYPSADIVSAADIAGDQGGQVNLTWDASRLDPWPNQSIGEYTVWRAIDPALAALFAGSGTPVVELGESFDATSTEAIRIETLAGQTYYWQLMSTVDAYYINNYAQTVPTLFDSTATSPDNHYFQVIAHGFGEFWVSAPASGKSIDNLAPAAPLLLTAQLTGPDVLLNWNPSGANEADFGEYAVYRATSSGVQPIPNLFLSSVDDTVLVDNNVPGGVLYYIVTARDVHGNQSNPSNEASVAISTAIGDHAPRLTQLTLEANYPNPFSHSTELRVGLPRASDVRLEVYDVAGRRVVARTVAQLGAGWQRVTFDGRDARGTPLPSGVYFGRVTAGGESQTMKMVIRR